MRLTLPYPDSPAKAVLTAAAIEETADITLSSLGQRFYQADCSGSYAKNGTLQAAASELLDSRDVDGVVYCVLKGQIEYDFELERFGGVLR